MKTVLQAMRMSSINKKGPEDMPPGHEEGYDNSSGAYEARAARRGAAADAMTAALTGLTILVRDRGSGDRARLDHEALLEREIDLLLDLERLFAHDLGHLRDDERLGAIQHALLAERQALGLAQERQALEHVRHVVDGAGPHLVGVVLEASFPVLMVVDPAVAEQREEPLNFLVGDGLAKADAVDVCHRNEHRRVVGDDAQVEKSAGGTQDGFFFDTFDDTEPVIRVDDLVADLESHVSPVAGRLVAGPNSCREQHSMSIADGRAGNQREMAEKGLFSPFQPCDPTIRPGSWNPAEIATRQRTRKPRLWLELADPLAGSAALAPARIGSWLPCCSWPPCLVLALPQLPRAPFVATPPDVVDRMLTLGRVGPGDVVYDLGCGDGRIVIAAAQKFGATRRRRRHRSGPGGRGQANAARAQRGTLVTFKLGDALETDVSDATVVTLYLLAAQNVRLRARLTTQLRPGARIVSHNFAMGDWEPDIVDTFTSADGQMRTLYLWRADGVARP